MKIRILDSASQDLEDGFHFYERQESGLGDYFIDSLFSDIDSLRIYARDSSNLLWKVLSDACKTISLRCLLPNGWRRNISLCSS